MSKEKMEKLIGDLLMELGEDPKREGLIKTPYRAAESLSYLTGGYRVNLKEVINEATFVENYDEMVVLRDIALFSLCEHHLLPFFGKCHVAYIPRNKILGLSKLARLVDMFARRLQVQERLTCQIAETLQEVLNPQGVGVVIEAQHLCMIMRGVEKQDSWAVTSHMLGIFRTHLETRMEFLRHINRGT